MKPLKVSLFVALSICWTVLTMVPSEPVFARPVQTSLSTPIRQCIESLCGPTEYLVNATGGGNFSRFQPQEVKALFKNSLKPMIEEIMDLEIANIQKLVEIWPSLESQIEPEKLSAEQKAILSIIKFTSSVDLEKINEVFEYKDNRITVNQKRWKELEPDRPQETIESTSQFIELLVNSNKYSYASSINSASYDFTLRYLGLKTPEAVKDWAGRATTLAYYRLVYLGPLLISESKIGTLQKLSQGEELNTFEKKAFVQVTSKLLLQDAYFNDSELSALLSKPPQWGEIKTIYNPAMERMRSALEDGNQIRLLKKRALDRCEKKINGYMSSVPSALGVRKAHELSESVKAHAQQVLRRLLSGKALKKASSAVQKSEFFFSGDKHPSFILKSFFQARKKDLENVGSLSETRNLVGTLAFYLVNSSKEDLSEVLFPGLTSLCSAIEPPSLTDKTLTNSQQILTSWQSVKWPRYGAPIIAHELGHVVSGAVGEKATHFPKAMSCIKERHDQFYDFQDQKSAINEEEDFADFFSAEVMKDLKTSWPYAGNMGCLLLPIDSDKEDFDPTVFDLLKTSEESHSSGFFRLIQTQFLSGNEISKSCQALAPVQRIMRQNARNGQCTR